MTLTEKPARQNERDEIPPTPTPRKEATAPNPLEVSLPYDMHPRAKAATADEQLQQFVNTATLKKDRGRRSVCLETFGDRYDRMRDLAGRIKAHTLDHLDYYLQRYAEAAEAAGIEVHFAPDAAEANRICLDIARAEGVKSCVKSKSMVTEETHLVPALQEAGIETIETDLGEFILQIDNDAPSHIVQPMIHKDRTAVGRAFARELGIDYTDDPQTLTKIAREHLREKYRRADLGVSGGNFLVADTGTVAICTNEGNGRLCTSLPRVHVAFVGIEKLVPSLRHLGVMLKLLARSSTSQPLTVYTHMMSGPKRAGEIDGPERMHVILVDNGRTNILKPETRDLLRCIRCGACLNACPVYRKVGGHAYGGVYSGPIGALITPLLAGLDNYPDLPNASSLCGACYEACPVKIDIPKYLIQLRNDLRLQGGVKRADRMFFGAWARSLRSNTGYRMGARMNRLMLRSLGAEVGGMSRESKAAKSLTQAHRRYVDRRWVGSLPGPLSGWTSQRAMPSPPSRGFRHWWSSRDV